MKRAVLLAMSFLFVLCSSLCLADSRPYGLLAEYSIIPGKSQSANMVINVYFENNQTQGASQNYDVRLASFLSNGNNVTFELPSQSQGGVPPLSRTLLAQLNIPINKSYTPIKLSSPNGGAGAGVFVFGQTYNVSIDIVAPFSSSGAVSSISQVLRIPADVSSLGGKILVWNNGTWQVSL